MDTELWEYQADLTDLGGMDPCSAKPAHGNGPTPFAEWPTPLEYFLT